MAVLSDYSVVLDGSVTIGDDNQEEVFDFDTGGRRTNSSAVLSFMVRGLTHANVNVPVRLGGSSADPIGHIHPYRYPTEADRDAVQGHWFAQHFAFPASKLNNGNNALIIKAVSFPEGTDTNEFDDFEVRDIICFFKQDDD